MVQHSQESNDLAQLPVEAIDRFVEPFTRFLHVEATSGILLVFVTVVAIALANSPFSDGFLSFWQMPVGFQFGSFERSYPFS